MRGSSTRRPRWPKIGFAPEEVEDVILTHLHFDHAGNLDRFPQRPLPRPARRVRRLEEGVRDARRPRIGYAEMAAVVDRPGRLRTARRADRRRAGGIPGGRRRGAARGVGPSRARLAHLWLAMAGGRHAVRALCRGGRLRLLVRQCRAHVAARLCPGRCVEPDRLLPPHPRRRWATISTASSRATTRCCSSATGAGLRGSTRPPRSTSPRATGPAPEGAGAESGRRGARHGRRAARARRVRRARGAARGRQRDRGDGRRRRRDRCGLPPHERARRGRFLADRCARGRAGRDRCLRRHRDGRHARPLCRGGGRSRRAGRSPPTRWRAPSRDGARRWRWPPNGAGG